MNHCHTKLQEQIGIQHRALLKWLLPFVCMMALSACANYSFKRKAPFEKTSDGFWYRADCAAPCDLHSEVAEHERLRKLKEKLQQENACPAGYRIEHRTPLVVTRTAPPDIVIYEGRCIK